MCGLKHKATECFQVNEKRSSYLNPAQLNLVTPGIVVPIHLRVNKVPQRQIRNPNLPIRLGQPPLRKLEAHLIAANHESLLGLSLLGRGLNLQR